ncbi:MAG: hypothetical protein H7338_01770 [Candidatus Sericytochromatia bacterium]|nr:hypothetical protein [Candidatus Sericytochromatia bacterium]
MASPADRRAVETLWHSDTETYGAPELRQTPAGTFDTLTPAQILCFAGAEEGLYVTMHGRLDTDEHAIVITLNVQSFEAVPLSRCATSGVALNPDDDWGPCHGKRCLAAFGDDYSAGARYGKAGMGPAPHHQQPYS